MGVPVITLAGRTHVSRVGVSLLMNMGLAELTAETPDDYVNIAAELANDLPRLRNLHSTLRERLERSPIMDAPSFARNIESAYRQMWRRWCGSNLCSVEILFGPEGAMDCSHGRSDVIVAEPVVDFSRNSAPTGRRKEVVSRAKRTEYWRYRPCWASPHLASTPTACDIAPMVQITVQ